MNVLITGGCGFIGSNLSIFLKNKNINVVTLDNLFRKGSRLNLKRLEKIDIKNHKIDVTDNKKILKLPKFDLIIDCCAEPAVEASRKSFDDASRVFYSNLIGTFNIIQKCIEDKSKLIFLSTSRVYSINQLNLKEKILKKKLPSLNKDDLIKENFPTSGPISLYGYTKLSSERLIEEFSYSNNLEFIINRFGVVAGPWQFGKTDQGFLSFWCWQFLNNKEIVYKGYGGEGKQIRDLLHIDDLCDAIYLQIKKFNNLKNNIFNISGGDKNYLNLRYLTHYLEKLSNNRAKVKKEFQTSVYDIPFYVGSNSFFSKKTGWNPKRSLFKIIHDTYDWQFKNKTILKKYFE